MRVHLINPSDVSFGIGVITPRWLYVLAAATPLEFGDPIVTDETLEQFNPDTIQKGDVVGIGVHTANAYRGFELGRQLAERGATVVYGGIHASLYPEEARTLGHGHAVVKGDGDVVWGQLLRDLKAGRLQPEYSGGRVDGDTFVPARWDLLPEKGYMWASVQTVRGCPKHCSFCSVWRTDGQKPRQRSADIVLREIVELRRMGYRFIALADDNFYPVTLTDIELAERQGNPERIASLKALRGERLEMMRRLAELPDDLVFFTQITMEAGEDPDFLQLMRKAHIRGALIGVESVTPEGLKSIFKDFNQSGDDLAARLRVFRDNEVHVLGSFIFGLQTDRESTFAATAEVAKKSGVSFAQFVMMQPYPGTVDFERWEKELGEDVRRIEGVPVTRYWQLPGPSRPHLYTPHPTMSAEEIRMRTQGVWDKFYSNSEIWKRAQILKSLKSKLAFFFISKLYRQMYANTGIATDSARRSTSNKWARWLAVPTSKLFKGKPMPELQMPEGSASPALVNIAGGAGD